MTDRLNGKDALVTSEGSGRSMVEALLGLSKVAGLL
jgi:hypothetical protein